MNNNRDFKKRILALEPTNPLPQGECHGGCGWVTLWVEFIIGEFSYDLGAGFSIGSRPHIKTISSLPEHDMVGAFF